MDCRTYIKAIVLIREPQRPSGHKKTLKDLLDGEELKNMYYLQKSTKRIYVGNNRKVLKGILAIEKLEETFWRLKTNKRFFNQKKNYKVILLIAELEKWFLVIRDSFKFSFVQKL